MKKLLVIISKDIIRRNIFDTGFWKTLYQNKNDWNITLLVEAGKEEWFKECVPNDVAVAGYERVSHKGFGKMVNFLVRTAGNTHSMRTYRNRALKRGQSTFLAYLAKAFIANTIGGASWYQKFVRRLVLLNNSPRTVKDLFDKHQPDLVFAPSLIDNDFDIPVSVEARRRNIPIVGMVRSWDNLNNHGLLALVPDKFLLQNKWLKEASGLFQSIDTEELPTEVVGLPHYDRYKDPSSLLISREEFFGQLGLDPAKKLIFLAGFDFYYSEDTLPATLNDLIEAGKIPDDVQVLFTKHPASSFSAEDYRIDELPHVTYLDLFKGKQMGFVDTEQTFINIAWHANVIVNVASTVTIDAAVFDRPVVCVGFDDPAKQLSYWEQAGRLHDHFDHYERLISTEGAPVAASPEKLAELISFYLKDSSKDQDGRKRIVELFVAPFDGCAGKRVAESVLGQMA